MGDLTCVFAPKNERGRVFLAAAEFDRFSGRDCFESIFQEIDQDAPESGRIGNERKGGVARNRNGFFG